MGFMDELKKVIEENTFLYTENGAKVYATTGEALLDMNYAVSSLRNATVGEILQKYACVLASDELLAIKWLFFVGDVRFGMGERRLFRICLAYLSAVRTEKTKKLLPLIAEYTRYDNLFVLLEGKLKDDVCLLIKNRLDADVKAMRSGKKVSLLAKWLPSVQVKSEDGKRYLGIILEYLGIRKSEYRRLLSELRAYMKVTERLMSDGKWGDIDYSAVASKANLIYARAFMTHDEQRRTEFLRDVSRGKAEIKSKVLFPYEIVHAYAREITFYPYVYKKLNYAVDETLEELWKALPDYVGGNGTTLCVADGSGSMLSTASSGSSVRALEVAQSLAVYFAERAGGEFHNKYITFSHNPEFVDFGEAKSLVEKLLIACEHTEVSDTNIEAVFDLILHTALSLGDTADIPDNILILSDMEFNDCAASNSGDSLNGDEPLFDVIAKRYEDAGVKMPRLIFWNISGRTLGIPVRKNNKGLAFVSGFSPSVFKMVVSGDLEPYKCLLEVLNDERYKAVEDALRD